VRFRGVRGNPEVLILARQRHHSRRTRPAVAVAIACLLAVAAAGCAGSEELTCGDAVIVDWSDGRLDSEYAPECYRDALETLPEDARLYSAAPEEIRRALRASLVARAPRRDSAREPGHGQAAARGGASRQLSGRHREPKPAPGGAEAEATAAPGALTGLTSLPLPVALTLTLIFVICAGAVTSSAARRLRTRRRASGSR
jgi:hypothetical protein